VAPLKRCPVRSGLARKSKRSKWRRLARALFHTRNLPRSVQSATLGCGGALGSASRATCWARRRRPCTWLSSLLASVRVEKPPPTETQTTVMQSERRVPAIVIARKCPSDCMDVVGCCVSGFREGVRHAWTPMCEFLCCPAGLRQTVRAAKRE
jgi:hypothetical protein